jgi:translation initiation factor IF-3
LQIVNRAMARSISQVRLVGEGTNQIVNAMEALTRAEEEGLDLILVSDKSTPPVVRIEDFKKILYEQKKAKAKQPKGSDLKEIQLKVNISDNDLKVKMAAIERFLKRGDKVKISVRLKGRERDTPERAHQLIERVITAVPCKASKVPGPFALAILEPVK